MLYRPATLADAEAIATIHTKNWSNGAFRGPNFDESVRAQLAAERRSVWEGRLSSPAADQFAVVAEEGGAVVAFVCTYGADDGRWGSLLDNLHVRADWQGKGLGKALFLQSAQWCATKFPECGMYLLVLADNTPARRLYDGFGAADHDGGSWEPPGGGRLASRLYAWTAAQVRELAG